MRAARGLITRNSSFRQLWLSRAISYLGDGAGTVGLLLLLRDEGVAPLAVGYVLLSQTLPSVLGPLAGVTTARLNPRLVLAVTSIGQGAVFAIIGIASVPYAVVIGLVATAAVLNAAYEPVARSAVPAIVQPTELVEANAWMATALNLQATVGPIVAGLLAVPFGARGGLVLDALTFLVAAGPLVTLRLPQAVSVGDTWLTRFSSLIRELARQRLVTVVLVTLFLGVAFISVDSVALVFLVRSTFKASGLAYGVASGCLGFGMVATTLTIASGRIQVSSTKLLVASYFLSGLGAVVIAIAPVYLFVPIGELALGVGNGFGVVALETIVQRRFAPSLMAGAFGLVGVAALAGSAVASVTGGTIVQYTSPRIAFAFAAAGDALVAGGLWFYLARSRHSEDLNLQYSASSPIDP
jgi:MFS family permease